VSVSNDAHGADCVTWEASVKSFCVDDNLMNVIMKFG
jgi:hypothetical protein